MSTQSMIHELNVRFNNDVKNLIPQGCLFKKHTPEF